MNHVTRSCREFPSVDTPVGFTTQDEIELLGIVRVARIGNIALLQEKSHSHRDVIGRLTLVYQHGVGVAPRKKLWHTSAGFLPG